jgi:hypothetical protein
MDFITTQQAADKWGVTLRNVQYYLKHNRVAGAVRFGHAWMIPKDAPKPADGRIHNRRQPKKQT